MVRTDNGRDSSRVKRAQNIGDVRLVLVRRRTFDLLTLFQVQLLERHVLERADVA